MLGYYRRLLYLLATERDILGWVIIIAGCVPQLIGSVLPCRIENLLDCLAFVFINYYLLSAGSWATDNSFLLNLVSETSASCSQTLHMPYFREIAAL